jgi:hypothetical protein
MRDRCIVKGLEQNIMRFETATRAPWVGTKRCDKSHCKESQYLRVEVGFSGSVSNPLFQLGRRIQAGAPEHSAAFHLSHSNLVAIS